jgi:hypothetical protein
MGPLETLADPVSAQISGTELSGGAVGARQEEQRGRRSEEKFSGRIHQHVRRYSFR